MEIETKYIWAIFIVGVALGLTLITILEGVTGIKKENYLNGATDLRDCLRVASENSSNSLEYNLLFCESTLRGDLMISDYFQKQEPLVFNDTDQNTVGNIFGCDCNSEMWWDSNGNIHCMFVDDEDLPDACKQEKEKVEE